MQCVLCRQKEMNLSWPFSIVSNARLVEYILLQEFATGTGVGRQQTSSCFLTQAPPSFPSPPSRPLYSHKCALTLLLHVPIFKWFSGLFILCYLLLPAAFLLLTSQEPTYLLYIPSLMCSTSAHQSPKKVLAQSIYVLLFDSSIYTNPPPPLSSTFPSVSSLSVVIKNGRSLLPQLFRSFK